MHSYTAACRPAAAAVSPRPPPPCLVLYVVVVFFFFVFVASGSVIKMDSARAVVVFLRSSARLLCGMAGLLSPSPPSYKAAVPSSPRTGMGATLMVAIVVAVMRAGGIIARPRRFGFLVFWWFFSGLLRAPPCAASWKRRGSRTPRDLRRLHGDPDRAAPSVGAGPGRCRSRSGLRSPSPLVLQPVSPVYCM